MSTITENVSSGAEKKTASCKCGHTEGQHVDMGHPRHRYTGCGVEGCDCKAFEQADEQDEAALVMEALKVVHGKPTMSIASKTLMLALHNSHVRTFQKINEILDGPGNEYAKLALIRRLTKAAGKGGAA